MKRVLPFVFVSLMLHATSLLRAQRNNLETCTITNVGVNVLDTATAANGCTARGDVYFVAKVTPNQKFFTAHVWERVNYPTVNYNPPGNNAPNAQALGRVLRTIVIERPNPNQPWRLSTTYPHPGVGINNTGLTLKVDEVPEQAGGLYDAYKGFMFFRISGVSLTTTAFCRNAVLAVDVWSSNANNNNTVNCVNRNVSIFACTTGDAPVITGNIICSTPNSYSLRFNNASGCRPYFISYDVYADVNGNGQIDNGDVYVVPDVDNDGEADDYAVLFPGQDSVTPPASLNGVQANTTLLVTAKAYTFSENNSIDSSAYELLTLTSSCTVLPVRFSSFSAVRNSQNKQLVNLQWETAQEQINKGFHVQRNNGGGWTSIAFIPSKAEGGNSSSALRYSFDDRNSFNGITQYRLLQEDLDGRYSYSDIKAIRGMGQLQSVVIYPNPGKDGKVNVMFPEVQTVRDVFVMDLNGRIVKQFREVAGNTLPIEGLTTGFYTIRVVDKKTNTSQVEKLIVQ